jgi:hypothetical protein
MTDGTTPRAPQITPGGRQLPTLHRASFQAIVGTWPFTVDEATPVQGARNPWSIGVVVNGVIYALNGTGKTWEHWADLRPIWADNPNIAGTKLSTTDLINYITARCWGEAAPQTPSTARTSHTTARPPAEQGASSDQLTPDGRRPVAIGLEVMDRKARAVIGKPLLECTAEDMKRLAADTTYINAELVVELAALELESPSKSGDDE